MAMDDVGKLREENHPFMHYVKAGNGSNVFVLFHGFGQDHTAFDSLITDLSSDTTLYSIDLYFHGQSVWHQGEVPLEKSFWKKIIEGFLIKNNIQRFSIIGFSLGAKFAMATTAAFPDRINNLILLAPDGIRTNPWYSLATYPVAIRKLFKSMVNKPNRFFALVRLATALHITDKSMSRFVKSQMDTPEKRKRVYNSWIVFRHLTFRMDAFGELLDNHHIPTLIITGKFDHVIVSKSMQHLKRYSKMVQLQELTSGHSQLLNHRDLAKTIENFTHSH